MEKNLQVITGFTNTKFEKSANNLEAELRSFAEIEGRSDALKSVQITELAFRVKIVDFTKSHIQKLVDELKQEMLATSLIVNAKELEKVNTRQCEQLQNDLDQRLIHLAGLKRKLENLLPDEAKRKRRKLLQFIATLVGVVDGMLCYYSFRTAYPAMMAFMSSLAIGATIAGSHLATVPWIRNANTSLLHRVRIGIVVGVAALFFGVVSNMRSAASQAAIDISVNPSSHQAAPAISGMAVFIISLTLFLAVLGMAMVFWRSKEEKQKDAEYEKVSAEIQHTEQEIDQFKKGIAEKEQKVLVQKKDARQVYDFVVRGIARAKNIGHSTITLYKQVYAKYRATLPEFFAITPDLGIDDNLNFFDASNKQS